MKKLALALLIFTSYNCVVLSDCVSYCGFNDDCEDILAQCLWENTPNAIGNAIEIIKNSCTFRSFSSYDKRAGLCDKEKIKELEVKKAEIERAIYAQCNQGNASACFDIGYDKWQECSDIDCDQTEALTYYSKACDLKDEVGCFNVGAILESNLFYRNPSQAQTYYRKACNMGYQPACFKLK